MLDRLSKHRIPATNIAAATNFLNSAPEATLVAFNAEFGLTPADEDALAVARFAADAVLRGAGAVDKVVAYVAKRMMGIAPKPVIAASPVIVGAPVVDTPEVVIAPVVELPAETAPVIKVKGKRGRKRLGNSDMCKAVAAIEGAPTGADRQTLLDCIIAAGIKQSSAVVYLWRYNKGERE